MTRSELEQKYRACTQDQFTSFMNAVKKARTDGNLNMLETQSMMSALITEQIETCREYEEKGPLMTYDEKDTIVKSARLIACYMTLLAESRSRKEMRAMALLLLEYAAYTVNSKYDLTSTAIKCLSYSLVDPGFSWSMIETCTSTDMIVYKMISKCVFDKKELFPAISLDGAGSITIHDGSISVSSCPTWEPSVKSFSVVKDMIEVCTRNIRDERLKSSDTEDSRALESFARTFLLTQKASRKMKAPKTTLPLTQGGRYSVKIRLCKDDEGVEYLGCYPLGTTREEMCEIKDEELVKGTYVSDLIGMECFFDDDCIEGARLIDETEPPLFSIKEAYNRYAKRVAEEDLTNKRVFTARVLDIFRNEADPEKDRVILVSDKGYGGLMRVNGEYRKGQDIVVNVISVISLGDKMFINMEEPQTPPVRKVEGFDNESALTEFIKPESDVSADSMTSNNSKDEADKELVRRLAKVIAHDDNGTSAERYRLKLAAGFISRVIEDEAGLAWSMSRAEYLNQCLRVAEGVPVKERKADVILTEEEISMINTLTYIDAVDDTAAIASLIQKTRDKEKENRIARILMALSLSRSMPDDVRTKDAEARREICKILGVLDHNKSSFIKGGGKYGNGELANVEFKSSYVMRNDGKGADIDYQGRGQVFEAVCGMLNADGGSVYIGVNNSGDPYTASDKGINGDIEWFKNNFDTLKFTRSRQLGHPVPMPKDLDTLCLFLNDEKSLYFKPSILSNITISPTEDYDAIRITVKPAEFEIVKLYRDNTWEDGVIYVRDGGETVPMNRGDQEKRLMKLRSVGKVEKFILSLSEAIDKQYKVTLKNYASSNSNERRDRFVVPINLVYNDENLWAYDIELKKPREFRLARVQDIEVIPEKYSHAFPKGEADVFRWINPDINYHVKLKLKVSALNTLLEDFSNAKNLTSDELYQISPERWILDTHLHGWGAVVRFYVGSCGGSKKEIEILDTEDSEALKEEIRKYKEAVTF